MGLLEFHEYCKSGNVSGMDAHGFAMYCKRWNERWNNPQTEAERLVYEITGNKKRKTNQEWLDLQKEVREFLKTVAEEDRKLIGGYTEPLCMICSAIKEGLRCGIMNVLREELSEKKRKEYDALTANMMSGDRYDG